MAAAAVMQQPSATARASTGPSTATPAIPPSLSLPLVPGSSVGPFSLGSTLGSCLSAASRLASRCGCRVELVSDVRHPLGSELVLSLPALGLRLAFEPRSQRMVLAEVRTPAARVMRYMGRELGAALDLASLYRAFGPTFPGEFVQAPSTADSAEKGGSLYMLQYPGLALSFRIPSSDPILSRNADSGEAGGHETHADALMLADGSSPRLDRLWVHGGRELSSYASSLPSLPVPQSGEYFEPLRAVPSRGVCFERRGVWVRFESTVQDLLSDLGAPQNVYVKPPESQRIAIHRPSITGGAAASAVNGSQPSAPASPQITGRSLAGSSPRLTPAGSPLSVPSVPLSLSSALGGGVSTSSLDGAGDYFFNYFDLGLDVLLDGETHRVKKIILRANWVERPEFGQYAKCNWSIEAADAGREGTSSAVSKASTLTALELPPCAVPPSSSAASRTGGAAMIDSHSFADADPNAPSSPSSSPPHAPATQAPPEETAAQSANGKKKKKKGGNGSASGSTLAPPSSSDTLQLPPRPSFSGSSGGSSIPSLGSSPGSSSMLSFSPSLSPTLMPQSDATSITVDSKWNDVLAVLGPCPSRPLVSSGRAGGSSGSSAASGSASTGPPSSSSHAQENPFDATYFYAYDGVIFEVMRNFHIASVTLFRDE